jgi:hypothetical protein
MRIFICYPRRDQLYATPVVEMLNAHEVWMDTAIIAGSDWENTIHQQLDWSQTLLLVITPNTFNSYWCQEEVRIAREKNKPIIPVRMTYDVELPDELKNIQYIDATDGVTPVVTRDLLNAVRKAEEAIALGKTESPEMERWVGSSEFFLQLDNNALVQSATKKMQEGRYEDVIILLRRAIENGAAPSKYFSLDALLREAEIGFEYELRKTERDKEYMLLAELVKTPRTRDFGRAPFEKFMQDFPDYDPQNLRSILSGGTNALHVEGHKLQRRLLPPIPMLEWIPISEGVAVDTFGVGITKTTRYRVKRFFISKYPITNAQFRLFVNDAEGYCNPRWWEFSAGARAWLLNNSNPQAAQFQGNDKLV